MPDYFAIFKLGVIFAPSKIRRYFYILLWDDLVAQLVEHVPFKDGVLGSSPSQVTKSPLRFRSGLFFKSILFNLFLFNLFFHSNTSGLPAKDIPFQNAAMSKSMSW